MHAHPSETTPRSEKYQGTGGRYGSADFQVGPAMRKLAASGIKAVQEACKTTPLGARKRIWDALGIQKNTLAGWEAKGIPMAYRRRWCRAVEKIEREALEDKK